MAEDIEEVEAQSVPQGMHLADVPMKNVCRCPLCNQVVGYSPSGIPTFHLLNRHPEVDIQAFKREWLGKIEHWKMECSDEDLRKRAEKSRGNESRREKARRERSANFQRSLDLVKNLDRKCLDPVKGREREWVLDAREQMRQQLAVLPEWQKLGMPEDVMTFVTLYVTNGFNARAAFKATFPEHRPKHGGVEWNPDTYVQRQDVQKLISAYMTSWLKIKGQELNHILVDTLYNMAFYDPADLINPDGSPAFTRWEDIPANLRRCIDHIETKYYGKDADRYSIAVTLTDRKKALESLSKFFAIMRGGFTETDQSIGSVSTETELLLASVLGGSRKVPGKVTRQDGDRDPTATPLDALQNVVGGVPLPGADEEIVEVRRV